MSRSLTHQVGILTLGRVLAYAIMFFVPIVNVRALSLEHYGYYRQFWLLFETITPLLMLGFPRSLLYYIPRAETDRDRSVYVTQTMAFLGTMAIVAWGVYTVMAAVLGSGMGALVRAFYWRLTLFTLFMMVSQFMTTLFVAEKKIVQQAAYHFVSAALQALVVIVLSWTTNDVNLIIWGLAIFAMMRFLFAAGYVLSEYRISLRLLSWTTVREQLSFALPLGLAGIALVLLSQTDKFIINRFLGREGFAIYAIGAYQVPFVNIIRGSITSVTFPLMAQYQKEGNYDAVLDLWRRSIVKTAVLFFPIFVFLEVSARPFITTLFTETYAGAVPVFAIYLFLFLRSTVETGGVLQVFKKNAFLFKVFLAGFFVNLGLSLALYAWIGRLGVPIATVIVMFLVHAVNLFVAGRLIHQPFVKILPWTGLAKRFTVAAIPGIAVPFVYKYAPANNILVLAAAGIGYAGVYLAICARLRYITLDELRSLVGRKPIAP